jgi:hypothetical protein
MELSYTNVERFIKPIFSHLGVHQLRNLILIVYGIIHCQSLECAEIARHIFTQTSHHHTKKRIHKFLGNEGVDWDLLMRCWCKYVVWYIATSLSDLDKAYGLYRRRMWIEEMFRDLKSRFHWCRYKVETEKRRERLTFCLMVSYTIVALLGYQVQKTGRAPIVSSYGKSSITWLGIGIINHRKASASALFRQIRRRLERISYKYAA